MKQHATTTSRYPQYQLTSVLRDIFAHLSILLKLERSILGMAGLPPPTTGYARYNDINLVEVKRESISRTRGLVLDSHPTQLDGTLEDNITLGRPTIDYQDLQWALRFVELDGDIDALPRRLNTPVSSLDTNLSMSQILRLLVARAIVTRPQLLIFDGTLHNMLPATREVLLRRLCQRRVAVSGIRIERSQFH